MYRTIKKYIFLLILIATTSLAMIQNDTPAQQDFATLSLPYINRSEFDPSKSIFVYESFAKTWNNKNNISVTLGALRPCIGVIMVNKENGNVVAIHKRFSTSIASIKPLLESLQSTDPTNIIGCLYTVIYKGFDKRKHGLPTVSFKDLHKGKTQSEELAFVKDEIIKALNITNPDQIEIIQHPGHCKPGHYYATEECIWTNGTLNAHGKINVFNISPLAEGLIHPDISKASTLYERFITFKKAYNIISGLAVSLYFLELNEYNEYNNVPAAIINEKYTDFLETLATQNLQYIFNSVKEIKQT